MSHPTLPTPPVLAQEPVVLVLDNGILACLELQVAATQALDANTPRFYDLFKQLGSLPTIQAMITTNTVAQWELFHHVIGPNNLIIHTHPVPYQPKHVKFNGDKQAFTKPSTHTTTRSALPSDTPESEKRMVCFPFDKKQEIQYDWQHENRSWHSNSLPRNFIRFADDQTAQLDPHSIDLQGKIGVFPTVHDSDLHKVVMKYGVYNQRGILEINKQALLDNGLWKNGLGEKSLVDLISRLTTGARVLIVSNDINAFGKHHPYDVKKIKTADGYPVGMCTPLALLEALFEHPEIREKAGMSGMRFLDPHPVVDDTLKLGFSWLKHDYNPNDPDRITIAQIITAGVEYQRAVAAAKEAAQRATQEEAEKQETEKQFIKQALARKGELGKSNNGKVIIKIG